VDDDGVGMSRACAILLVVLALVACVRSTATDPPAVARAATSQTPTAPIQARPGERGVVPDLPLAQPAWPALNEEPELGVMMMRGQTVRVRLLLPHRTPEGGNLPAGIVDITASGSGFRVAGHSIAGPQADLVATGSGNRFSVDGVTCSGRLRLAKVGSAVEVIEMVGLETWLAGVLPAEMQSRWPIEALAAQAIVARSYAAARWQNRKGQAWTILRGTADIAYDGAVEPTIEVATAIARTRGELLIFGGQAIMARFHACSGGRTEDSAALWPDALLPDKRTPLARFSRPVDDPASVEGARGLKMTRTHQQWRAAITVDELSERLGTWSRAGSSRPRIGTVKAVAIAKRTPSGRVAQVSITHRLAGSERSDEMNGLDFRLAVGANQLRSLWWEKVAMASSRGGQLVVEGRGFGHGVGLPQVSAWFLAQDGVRGEDIVSRYFPGATLAKMWK